MDCRALLEKKQSGPWSLQPHSCSIQPSESLERTRIFPTIQAYRRQQNWMIRIRLYLSYLLLACLWLRHRYFITGRKKAFKQAMARDATIFTDSSSWIRKSLDSMCWRVSDIYPSKPISSNGLREFWILYLTRLWSSCLICWAQPIKNRLHSLEPWTRLSHFWNSVLEMREGTLPSSYLILCWKSRSTGSAPCSYCPVQTKYFLKKTYFLRMGYSDQPLPNSAHLASWSCPMDSKLLKLFTLKGVLLQMKRSADFNRQFDSTSLTTTMPDPLSLSRCSSQSSSVFTLPFMRPTVVFRDSRSSRYRARLVLVACFLEKVAEDLRRSSGSSLIRIFLFCRILTRQQVT